MNHTENPAISPHLLAERARLLDLIQSIRQSGEIAPAYCWLVESSETKGLQTYTYIKLVTQQPGKRQTIKSLGKPGSRTSQTWRKAIERREQIGELEQQLKILTRLIERQQNFPSFSI